MTARVIARADARRLPLLDESAHLIVTSPPYNAGVRYDVYDDRMAWDAYWQDLIEPSLRECYRVLVDGGRIAVNIANVCRAGDGWPLQVVPKLWQALTDAGFLPRETLTWVKANHQDEAIVGNDSTAWGSWCSASNPVLRAVAEPVLIASKGTYRRERGLSDLTPAEFKAWTRNVWFITTGHKDQYLKHPAMFPQALPHRLIKLYSYVGDVVLDPFAGSGTTVRAALDCGRRGVGFDLSERYCRLAAGRSSQITLLDAPLLGEPVRVEAPAQQPGLFDGEAAS